MNNLFSLSFWFRINPGIFTPIYQKILIGIILIFILLSILFWFKKKKRGKNKNFILGVWRKFYDFFTINSFLGLLLLFFCFEKIPFFSSRFWFILWGIEMITWLFFIFKHYKTIPSKIEKIEAKESYEKYLP